MSAVVGNMAIDGAQRMRGAIGDTRRQRAQGVAAHLGAATGHKARADNFPLTYAASCNLYQLDHKHPAKIGQLLLA